jgi:hypothetical protein
VEWIELKKSANALNAKVMKGFTQRQKTVDGRGNDVLKTYEEGFFG